MYKYLLVLSALIMAAPTWADFTTNMGSATRYMFRGVKQSDADIVVSAGADYQAPFGLYAGAWGYTGAIEDLDTSEVNAYAGAAYSLAGVSFGLGVIQYERGADSKESLGGPGTSNTEYNFNIAWDAYRFSAYEDEETKARYHEVAANYSFWGDSGMTFTAGMTQPDGESSDETWNYGIGFVKAMPSNVDFEVLVTRQDEKGNSLILGISRQFDW